MLPFGELLLVALLGFLGGAFGFEVGKETHGWIMAWLFLFVEVIGGQKGKGPE